MQPVAKQRLMKAEKVLEGEGSRLADLGIEYDDELLLVYKLEGDQFILKSTFQSSNRVLILILSPPI